jgi:hypothetical protein
MRARLGRPALLLALAAAVLAALPTAAAQARRKHKRPGCGSFCQNAGPPAGDFAEPPILLKAVSSARGPFTIGGGVASIDVSCHLTKAMTKKLIGSSTKRGCVGAMFLVDGALPSRHGEPNGPQSLKQLIVGAVDLAVPSHQTDTVDVPITAQECADVQRLGRIGQIQLYIQLEGRIYIQDPKNPHRQVLDSYKHQDLYSIDTSLVAGSCQ